MTTSRPTARRLCTVALVLLACSGARASERDVRRAYDAARRCYVANGEVYSAFKRNGDATNAALFEKKAHTAYDLAYSYGDRLQLSQLQITADLKETTDTELPKLVGDNAYLTTVAKDCKYWGMM